MDLKFTLSLASTQIWPGLLLFISWCPSFYASSSSCHLQLFLHVGFSVYFIKHIKSPTHGCPHFILKHCNWRNNMTATFIYNQPLTAGSVASPACLMRSSAASFTDSRASDFICMSSLITWDEGRHYNRFIYCGILRYGQTNNNALQHISSVWY